MIEVVLPFEKVLVVKVSEVGPEGSCGASCPFLPKVAVRVCAAMRVFHPVMKVLVVLLTARFVANVSVDCKRFLRVVATKLATLWHREGGSQLCGDDEPCCETDHVCLCEVCERSVCQGRFRSLKIIQDHFFPSIHQSVGMHFLDNE